MNFYVSIQYLRVGTPDISTNWLGVYGLGSMNTSWFVDIAIVYDIVVQCVVYSPSSVVSYPRWIKRLTYVFMSLMLPQILNDVATT